MACMSVFQANNEQRIHTLYQNLYPVPFLSPPTEKGAILPTPLKFTVQSNLCVFRWMISSISSCSACPTPMLSSASLVAQSGQMSVELSFRDSAGYSLYSLPQIGQILVSVTVIFILSCLPCFFSALLSDTSHQSQNLYIHVCRYRSN